MRTALAALTPEQRRALLRVLTAPEPVRADPGPRWRGGSSGILTDRLDPAGGKRDAGVEQRFRKPQVVGSSPTSGSAPMFGSA